MRQAWAVIMIAGLMAACNKGGLRVSEYHPSASYTTLHAALDTCTSTGSAVKLARDYMEKYPDDVAVQIFASSVRYDMTADEQIVYYRERADRQPNNIIAQYLAGRATYSPSDGKQYADEILAKQPDNYWGHLLLGRSFTWKQDLTDDEFTQAERELKRALEIDNSLPFAVESLGYLYAQRGDTSQADQAFAKLCEMEPAQFEHVRLRLDLVEGDEDHDLDLVNRFLKKNATDVTALSQKAELLFGKRDWPEYRKTLTEAIAVKRDSVFAYDIACSYAVQKQADSALSWIQNAIAWGYADVDNACDDPDLENVRDDPRWDDLKRQMAEQHALQIAELSKREVAESKQQRADWKALGLSDAAPEFTLLDLDSGMVSLASLKGKVVVLDFWATWCYWCHKASPLIEEFSTTADTHRVAILGINVMEREVNAEALKAFQMQRGVHFPTLLGTQDVAEHYKVIGLPSIFVIDPQGKLAYRAYGFSPALGETLKAISGELLNTDNPRPAVMEVPAS